MGADLYIKLKNPKIWGMERSDRAVEDGYFRDAYNSGSILNQFDLSWWVDIGKLKDKEGQIPPVKVKKFLTMIDKNQAIFDKNMENKPEEEVKYFKEGAELLRKFLNIAIKEKSPIDASL